MSYILDALRKAERERRRETEPTLLTVHVAGGAGVRPGGLVYAGLAFILIGAGIAVGQWHPWTRAHLPVAQPMAVKSEPDLGRHPADLPAIARHLPGSASSAPLAAYPEMVRPKEPQVAASQPVAPQATPSAREEIHPRATVRDSLRLTDRPAAPPPEPKREVAVSKSEPVASAAGASAPVRTAAVPPPDAVSGTPLQPVAPPGQVVQFSDLPDAIRKEIPDMSIQIHTYSATPGERIVGINGRLLQEGDYLAEGLKLEQITPNGMIFSYKNFRFRRGLP